eukprot:236011-Pleurochrysis_carterae.AAC.1
MQKKVGRGRLGRENAGGLCACKRLNAERMKTARYGRNATAQPFTRQNGRKHCIHRYFAQQLRLRRARIAYSRLCALRVHLTPRKCES